MSSRYLFTAVVFLLWIAGFSLASNVGGVDLLATFMRASPLSILAGIGLYATYVLVCILVLYYSLGYARLKVPFMGVAKGWMFGSFIDNISPTVAPLGKFGTAYFMERFYNVAYSKSLAALGMYMSSWGVSASIFSTVSIILSKFIVGIPDEYFPFAIFALVFYFTATAIWLLLLTKKEFMRKAVHVFIRPYNKVYDKLMHKKVTFDSRVYDIVFDRSYASLALVMKSKTHLMASVALFLIPQLGQVLGLYFIIVGFGVSMPFFALLMIHVVSSMTSFLSVIPGGLFVYEAAIVTLSNSVAPGMSQFILAAVLLYRLIFLWGTNLFGGLIGIVQGIGRMDRKSAPHYRW
jgi:uncharacterized protein (TIRG00374 family)